MRPHARWILAPLCLLVVTGVVEEGAPTASQVEEDPLPEDPEPTAEEADDRRPLGERWKAGARHVGQDGLYLITFPRRPTRRGVIKASAFGAGVLALILLDDEIREEVQEARNDTLDRWEERIEPLGDAGNTAIAALATYGFGRLLRHERASETGRSLIEALLFTETFNAASKGLFGREPPGDEHRASDFLQGSSFFPSGHTARAFAVATVLAERHGRPAAWIGYPLAGAVGLSRIVRDVHWASDVFAGAALGHLVARTVVRRRETRAAPRVQFMPVVFEDPATAGVLVRIRLSRRVGDPAEPTARSAAPGAPVAVPH